jgi:hypothetical protein
MPPPKIKVPTGHTEITEGPEIHPGDTRVAAVAALAAAPHEEETPRVEAAATAAWALPLEALASGPDPDEELVP